jgi:D-glycero-alpha-D-manno-heptose-7-phosphate kinase
VCNVAVTPLVRVELTARPRRAGEAPVLMRAVDYGDEYEVVPDDDRRVARHPLLEAAVDEVGVDPGARVEVTIRSDAPPGSSTGTSAAVAVAVVGALVALRDGKAGPPPALEVARTAHRLETERLGLQSGIQDQLASAFGGVNRIDMTSYPTATVTSVTLADATWAQLDRRLLVVFLGRRHDSSAVHDKVIAELEGEGPGSPRLEVLRDCARRGHDALAVGDLDAFGAVLRQNTEAQRSLHAELVGREAEVAIAVARDAGCVGWKVNGAGGEGGSVALLAGERTDRSDLERALVDTDPSFVVLPSTLSRAGLTVSVSASTRPSR